MTIKEIVEKYSELAKSSELGENTKVTGLEFSKVDLVKVRADLSVSEESLRYATNKKAIVRDIDREVSDKLLAGIRSKELTIRSQSKENGMVVITDVLWCLKPKKQ